MELLEFLTHLVQAVCAREAKETYGERNSGERARGETVQRSGRASPRLDL